MNGVIIINKQKEYTSHDVVNVIKKALNTKVGHAGTLDPNATGVLPLLIGKGTLISKYLIDHDKTYEVTLKLGNKTDTLDGTGNIIETKKVEDINEDKINKVLKSFQGEILQKPPMYSAIKVNGRKLYEYARKGKTVEVKPRKIEIYSIELKNIDRVNYEIDFTVKCSKGTYIRVLCEDIANNLGTIGYMKELNRTQVGIFNISRAVTIEEIKKNKDNIEYLKDKIITIEELFKDKEDLILSKDDIRLFLNGVQLNCKNHNLKQPLKDDVYRVYDNGKKYIGLGIVEANILKRDVC